MSKVVLLGGGGHCKVVIDHLQLSGVKVVGILDDNPKTAGKEILGCRVIGPIEQLAELKNEAEFAVIAVTDPAIRMKFAAICRDVGFKVTGFIHPAAVISSSATIAPTAQICAGAIINPEADIKDHVVINTRAVVEHDCWVGPYCHIAPSVSLMGNVHVGALTLIGASSVVIPNLRLGSEVIVGAGAIIVKNIAGNSKYVSTPARKMD
jgi:UDP-perosamine 4-acetyltransferase